MHFRRPRPLPFGPAPRPRHLYLAVLLLPALILAGAALWGGGGAAAQSTQGVIAYSGADHNIWRIGADGGDRQQLTQDGGSDNPDWTPNGGQIVFSSIRDQKVITTPDGSLSLNQIYIMGSDGSNQTALSDGSSDDRYPVVTPGGDQVVFLRTHNWRTLNGSPARDTEVGSMRLDGTGYRILGGRTTTGATRIDRYPAQISADSTKIVMIQQQPGHNSEILLLNVATGQFNPLTPAIDRGTTDGTVEYLWPRFDPQGHIVVLRRVYTYGPIDVRLISMDTDGSNIQTLIGSLPYEGLANGFDVNWAAHTLIGARSPEMPGGLRPEEIYLYDLATGTPGTPLDSGHAPSFTLSASAPPAPTPTAGPATPTPGGGPGGPTPTAPPSGPVIDTADPLFYSVWERVDRPVKENVAARSWIWGPQPFTGGLQEPYGDTTRLVQYFDKARMELNPAAGNKPAYVTNGLLVVEMLSGRVQIGPTQYQQKTPATVLIGGDGPNNPAPSYAVFAKVASLAGENKASAALHQPIVTTLSNTGAQGTITFPATERIAYWAPETSHNVPEVFFNFLNQTGKVYVRNGYHDGVVLDWVFTVGYPISEAYWTKMSIAGKVQDVMVQAFQRQILTYIPAYQAPWNVQFGNVGLQYYQWRYGRTP